MFAGVGKGSKDIFLYCLFTIAMDDFSAQRVKSNPSVAGTVYNYMVSSKFQTK